MNWDTVIGGGALLLTFLGGLLKLSAEQSKTRTTVDQHHEILSDRGERIDNIEKDLASFKERVAQHYVPYAHMQRLEEKMERGFAELQRLLLDRLHK